MTEPTKRTGRRLRLLFPLGLIAIIAGAVAANVSSAPAPPTTPEAKAAVQAALPLVKAATSEQKKWLGPVTGPKGAKAKSIVCVMGLGADVGSIKWCLGAKQAAQALGWKYALLDGKGSVAGWQSALEQAIALNPDGILIGSFDAETMKSTIQKGRKKGIFFVGVHSTSLPGPYPQFGVFTNVSGDGRDIGRKSGAYAVWHSGGTAQVVSLGDETYAISRIKSGNTLKQVAKCKTCKALKDDSLPVGEAPQRTPDRFTSYLQNYGTNPPLYIYSVTDFYLDSGVPALRSGHVPSKGKVYMIGSDGSPGAYDRIRNGEYQVATVPEPLLEEGWVMVDEMNRAIQGAKPSGYVPAVHIIDNSNMARDVTKDSVYEPHTNYRNHYKQIWKTGKTTR